jgi:hypothetical protein
MNDNSAYKTPEANLNEHKNVKSVKISVGKRFLITFLWAFLMYMAFLLLSSAKEDLHFQFIGFVFFSFCSGIVAMLIPTKYKIIFVSTGILVVIIAVYILGTYFVT